ncbi:DUF262 domain-containing protein (plasmid) [Rhizobium leguminosarum]
MIDLNPAWQRGPAWQAQRQSLLVDSILRGMDIPKIYLRKRDPGSAFSFEAVDGQQRLRALWAFREGKLELSFNETPDLVDGLDLQGKKYRQLPKRLKDRFDNFSVSIAEIVEGSTDEITNLFSRLQMGMSLNPAELRNAVLGAMRHVVDMVATSHPFFVDSRIADSRYKRQDFSAHAFAMAAFGGEADIKAPDLKRMFQTYRVGKEVEVQAHFLRVGAALTVLAEVNAIARYRITQKWIFVDLTWLIMQFHEQGVAVNPDILAEKYIEFEKLRRDHIRNPDRLLTQRGRGATARKHLYNYIVAFKAQGGTKENLLSRNVALKFFIKDIEV